MGWVADLLKEIPSAARYKAELEEMASENETLLSKLKAAEEKIRDLEAQLLPPLRDGTDRDFTDEQLNTLQEVANSEDGLFANEETAARLQLHPQRLKHVMEGLEERKLLSPLHNYVYGTSWRLTKAGRAFLVESGLL